VEKIVLYVKPTCSTCRQAVELVKQSGQPFETVAYFEQRFSKAKLRSLVDRMGLKPSEYLRTKEETFKKLKMEVDSLSAGQAVDLMLKHPELIQRPIAEKGEKVMLARPADRIRDIL
jgi:arsenate reductase